MRVRIAYTVEITDDLRREIRRHYGRPGLASRAEVHDWYRTYGESMDPDLSSWAADMNDDAVDAV